MGIGGTLYKSVCRAARVCDANPALRRHVLTRLVREQIYIDNIHCQESARQRLNDESFSMVRTVSAHFRHVALSQHLPAAGAMGRAGWSVASRETEAREREIAQAFEALKIYRAAVERIGAKSTLARPFEASGAGIASEKSSAVPSMETDRQRAEQEVLEANAEFYAAIREGSLDRLGRICQQSSAEWGQPGCVHPARGLIQGWGRIAESWDQIFEASEAQDGGIASAAAAVRLEIGLLPETVQVNLPAGSNVAWVTGAPYTDTFASSVTPRTNPTVFVYLRGRGVWGGRERQAAAV